VGIIDYLQVWSFEKRVEAKYKIKVKKHDANMISAVEPHKYATRFQDFMCQQVFAMNKKL
jgi:hypothetical protein